MAAFQIFDRTFESEDDIHSLTRDLFYACIARHANMPW
jgi:hypothetical protein